ncbi:formate dehydrogenase accessory protein FdhE [Desulfotignum phosphitoxidans]|uniref:Formate dehydrogenase accessory protein FdhE n=1 Tax=Desulfotignum phosphitoxidans DSM 13687 TaxID=1286635 RepID=S0G6X0_9BACT|nr:formate dehydrogenase accessory protein FdhE [Desulfotignum phosphitoxidans]EMS80652.1 formate dehydrogenase accessory protein FdhE [Desulfotignum phosphitoxidans DSM 13687]
MAPDIPMENCRNQILKKRPAYTDILNFYVQVFQAQEENRQQILMDPISMYPSLVEKKIRHDKPLINPNDFVIDQNAAVQLMTTLCDIAQNQHNALSQAAVALQAAITDLRIDPGQVFDALLNSDGERLSSVSETIGISLEHLIMFSYLSMAPGVEVCAEQLSGYLENPSHAKGYCPICGNLPDLFFLDDNGKRHLKCSFCSHSWQVDRMGCLFCDSKDPELHPYFFSPEEKEYRVDVCDACRKYIKGVDTRHLDRPFVPKIELVATLHLDIKAKEAGYTGLSDGIPNKEAHVS